MITLKSGTYSIGSGLSIRIGHIGIDIFKDEMAIASVDTYYTDSESGSEKDGYIQTVIYDPRPEFNEAPVACAVHTDTGTVIHPGDSGMIGYDKRFSQLPCIVTNPDCKIEEE